MDRPLRILHLTAGSDAGGLSRYIHDLCHAMHQQGHQVAVAGERGADHYLFESEPWPWIDLPLKGGPLALWSSARRLRSLLANQPYDLLHAHYRRTTLVARRLKRQVGIPCLFTLHQPGILLAPPWSWLSDFGDHTHVPSQAGADWLSQQAGVPPAQITVIPHGINPAQFPLASDATQADARRSLGLDPQAVIAGFVGRFDVPKNEDWIIDLALAARDRLPHLHLVMMGQGPGLENLERRRCALDLVDRVTILPYGDPLPIYQAIDALLVPSLREGFSLVTAEAMCVGRPVFRTDTGGAKELILPHQTGQTCPINLQAFVAGALDFLADPASLRRMGQQAAQHVRLHFTFDRQVQKTLALYRHILATNANDPEPMNR